jgi:hypothetical protein
MKSAVWLALILLIGCLVSCEPKTGPGQGQSTPAAAGPGKGFEIKIASIERVQQWRPTPKGVKALLLVKGVSLIIGQGYVADKGYELVIVHLNIKRVVDGATLPLTDVAAIDDKGEKHLTVYDYEPLGKEAEEPRDFIFPVKTGTPLKKLQLAPDVSIDLP